MLRLKGRPRPPHQSYERVLQNILGLPVAQTERAAVQDQFRRLVPIQRFAPDGLFLDAHDSKVQWDRHQKPAFCIKFVASM